MLRINNITWLGILCATTLQVYTVDTQYILFDQIFNRKPIDLTQADTAHINQQLNKEIIKDLCQTNSTFCKDIEKYKYWTPLMLAVKYSNVDEIKKLVNHGANVNAIINKKTGKELNSDKSNFPSTNWLSSPALAMFNDKKDIIKYFKTMKLSPENKKLISFWSKY